eukprot:1769991-Amphidinium_carterae.1
MSRLSEMCQARLPDLVSRKVSQAQFELREFEDCLHARSAWSSCRSSCSAPMRTAKAWCMAKPNIAN